MHTYHCACGSHKSSQRFPPCGSRGLNPGPKAWWQAPSRVEPSRRPKGTVFWAYHQPLMVALEINLSHSRAAVSSTLTVRVPRGLCTCCDWFDRSLTPSTSFSASHLSSSPSRGRAPVYAQTGCVCPASSTPPTFLAVFGSASVAMTTAQLLPPAEPPPSSFQGLRAPPPRSFLLPASASTLLRDSRRLRRRSSLPLSGSCRLFSPADSFLQES